MNNFKLKLLNYKHRLKIHEKNTWNKTNFKYLRRNIATGEFPGFKSNSKAMNVTFKYGMSQDFPFKNSNTLVHPSTKMNIKEAGSNFVCFNT